MTVYSDVSAATPSTFETPQPGRTPLTHKHHHTHNDPPNTHSSGGDATVNPEGPPDAKKQKPEDYTLDRFLSKYESEDDASFADIMEKTKEAHREKHAWLYEKEEEYRHSIEAPEPMLAITEAGEGSHGNNKEPERSGVKSWAYTVKNTLMYVPDGLEQSALEKLSDVTKKREVVHSNTRLSSAFVRKVHGALKGAGEGESGKVSKDKVGIDGKVVDPSSSPQVDGYGFVATPQIQPGTVVLCTNM